MCEEALNKNIFVLFLWFGLIRSDTTMENVIYIALLRGINVAGKNIVKMGILREIFLSLDFGSVRTYLQSGNVVFRGPKHASEDEISKRIEASILNTLGLTITVIVKMKDQFEEILKRNPFVCGNGLGSKTSIDKSKLHVTFLSGTPDVAGLTNLESIALSPDKFQAMGNEIYLYCPNGYGRTKLTNNAIERALELGATTRNWNTVTKLSMLCQD